DRGGAPGAQAGLPPRHNGGVPRRSRDPPVHHQGRDCGSIHARPAGCERDPGAIAAAPRAQRNWMEAIMHEQRVETPRPGRLSRTESATWGGGLLLGLLWAIAGVLCLVATGTASVAAVYWVGALLAVGGIVSIVWSFRGAGGGAAVLGILSLVV